MCVRHPTGVWPDNRSDVSLSFCALARTARVEERKKKERKEKEDSKMSEEKEEGESVKSDIRNKAKLIFCLARHRGWFAVEPVYFKRINFPFDQRTGLLVCGVELTARVGSGGGGG